MSDKWDIRFLNLAIMVGGWSKDPRTKVGAVITDKKNRIVSLGFNGYPNNLLDTIDADERSVKLLKVIHAEENAILFSRTRLDDFTIYVTHPPCPNCVSKILQIGIKRIVYIEASKKHKINWEEKHQISLEMMNYAKVEHIEFKRKLLNKAKINVNLLALEAK